MVTILVGIEFTRMETGTKGIKEDFYILFNCDSFMIIQGKASTSVEKMSFRYSLACEKCPVFPSALAIITP